MKKVFFGLLVAVTAIGGSVATYASSLVNVGSKTAPTWFRYVSGDEEQGTSYTQTDAIPSNCTGGTLACAVLAEPDAQDPSKPNLTGAEIYRQL